MRGATREFELWRDRRSLLELLFAADAYPQHLADILKNFRGIFLAALEAEVYPINDHPARPRLGHGAFFGCRACHDLFFVQAFPFGDRATVFFDRCPRCVTALLNAVQKVSLANVDELRPQIHSLMPCLAGGVIFFLAEKAFCTLEGLAKTPAHRELYTVVMNDPALPFRLLNYLTPTFSTLLAQAVITFFRISSSSEDEEVCCKVFQDLIAYRTTPIIEKSALCFEEGETHKHVNS